MSQTLPRTQQELITFLERTRGGRSDEIKLIAALDPAAAYHLRMAYGYVHAYEDLCSPDQVLSASMRELIAFNQLCAKGEERLATYHIQRLYKLGVTESVIMEAAAAAAPVVGWSMMFLAAKLILADRQRGAGGDEGGGAPDRLTTFPELGLGHDRVASTGSTPDRCLELEWWRYGRDQSASRGARRGVRRPLLRPAPRLGHQTPARSRRAGLDRHPGGSVPAARTCWRPVTSAEPTNTASVRVRCWRPSLAFFP